MADTSAESVKMAARSSALVNSARRAIWLKTWTGDTASKVKLCGLPFSDDLLFGTDLETVLNRTASNDEPPSGSDTAGSNYPSPQTSRTGFLLAHLPSEETTWKASTDTQSKDFKQVNTIQAFSDGHNLFSFKIVVPEVLYGISGPEGHLSARPDSPRLPTISHSLSTWGVRYGIPSSELYHLDHLPPESSQT